MKYASHIGFGIITSLLLSLSACQNKVSETVPTPTPSSAPVESPGTVSASPTPTASPVDNVTPQPTVQPTTPPTPQPSAAPSRPTADAYTRRPVTMTDQVVPGSDFDQFRNELKQAVQNRNAAFIRAIAAPDIHLTFGRPITLNDLDIDNPNAPFWQQLDRIVNIGCAPIQGVPGDGWSCPHVFQSPQIQDAFQDVFIVGEDINVRAEPRADSAVVDVVSNEIVKPDMEGMEGFSEAQLRAMETMDGWRPVITPKGHRGYVSSRYAYLPAGYRTYFMNQEGSWKMTVFIAGD